MRKQSNFFISSFFLLNKLLILAIVVAVFTSCKSSLKEIENPSEVIAKYTAVPVKIDGKINDKSWENACGYQLGLAKKAYARYPLAIQKNLSTELVEHGEFKLLWDKQFLYVGIKYYDSDIVADGAKDQMRHYAMGDVAEVFLKPLCETYYWELYVTPAKKQTCFFFPGRGRLFLPSCEKLNMTLKTSAYVNGSINSWQDKDNYWTAEMAIPIKGLTQYGAEFGTGSQWLIFIARYNYSRYLPLKELSSYPVLDIPDFHTIEEYAQIKFEN